MTAANQPPSSSKQPRDKSKDRRLVGQVVGGKYKVVSLLGQGGFGSVFLVEMTSGIVGDRLAMKVLPEELSQNDVFREQFINEIRVAMKMVDKHVVQIRDVGVLEGDESVGGGLLYYTMDYVEGQPLSQIIRDEGRLTVPRTLRIVRRILPALRTAHSAGIIHRDLKPANVMVETDAEGRDNVRVLDFGIATAIDSDSTGSPDSSEDTGKKRGFAGSPYYMPPEQFRSREMGFYTDLYSVGVILYECITGTKPYSGATPQEIYNNIKKGPPVRIDELAPEVSAFPGLAELVMKALERNPQKRFQTAKEFFEQLNAVISGRAQTDSGETTKQASGESAVETPSRSGPSAPRRTDPARREAMRRKVRREQKSSSRAGWLFLFVLILGCVGFGLVFEDKIREYIAKRSGGSGPNDPTAENSGSGGSSGQNTGQIGANGNSSSKIGSSKTAGEKMRERRTNRSVAEESGDGRDGETEVDARRRRSEKIAQTIEKYYREGLTALAEKKFDDATARAAEIDELRRGEQRGLFLRGAALLGQGQPIEARPILEDAAKAKTQSVRLTAAVYLARTCLQLPQPDWDCARGQLEAVLEIDKKNAPALLAFCDYYERRQKPDELKKIVAFAHEQKVTEPRLVELYKRFFVQEPEKIRKRVDELLASGKEALAARDFHRAGDLLDSARGLSATLEITELAADANALSERFARTRDASRALTRIVEASDESSEDPSWPAKKEFLEGRTSYLEFVETGKDSALENARLALARAVSLSSKKKNEHLYSWARTYHGMVLAAGKASDAELDEVEKEYRPTVRYNDLELMYLQAKTYMSFGARVKRKDKDLRKRSFELAKSRLLLLAKSSKVKETFLAKIEARLGRCDLAIAICDDNDPNDLRSSRRHFKRAKELGLDTAEISEFLAQTYVIEEDYIRAAVYFSDANDRAPSESRLIKAIEFYLKASPRNTRARELIEVGLEKYPSSKTLKKLAVDVGDR